MKQAIIVRRKIRPLILVVLIVLVGVGSPVGLAQPANNPPPTPVSNIAAKAERPRPPVPSLSSYDFGYQDGLYAMVTLDKRLKEVKSKVEDEKKIKLKGIPGFEKEIKVQVLWQKRSSAPLAIPILGLTGRNNDRLARRWQSLLYQSGCHVMTFDSVFGEEFSKRARQGASGSVRAEADSAIKVIAAFLRHEDVQGRVSEVRLLGTSYGGTLSLEIARRAKAGELNFSLGPVLALSPTLSLRTAARVLDSFYEKDFGRYNYDMFKLQALKNEKLVAPGEPIPFSPTLMKAGIGYSFRGELKNVVEKSNKLYRLGILERYKDMPKPLRDLKNASKWTFERYIEEMAYVYWKGRGSFRDVGEFWRSGELRLLLNACPGNVHVVEAQDDPLNDPRELADLQSSIEKEKLTVLPSGSHLGYATTKWVEDLIVGYFKN